MVRQVGMNLPEHLLNVRRVKAMVITLALILLPGCAEAPKKAGPPRVDHILLEVSDMSASLAFYRDLLGFRVKSNRGDFVTLEAANTGVALWSKRWDWEAPRTKGERLGLGIYPHIGVASATAVVEQARRAGYRIVQEPRKYPWGTEAFIADPDGYIWAIID